MILLLQAILAVLIYPACEYWTNLFFAWMEKRMDNGKRME